MTPAGMSGAAREAGYLRYIEAERRYKESADELNNAHRRLVSLEEKVFNAQTLMRQAAKSYFDPVDSENSVTPACKCDCKGS
jgi:hypothetical protein